ncbi:phytanoyl-CoA dioxygenase family protein [Sphingomonas sp. ERG5]|uniref:phytanoyl-CoA dioxygenase family protein n=1 Tax=Sphingomonas sp. ERG5 TaxID=1381597 RepID=UPI00054B1106|nr:phytanoyl-CoA dioxygenase family protein [Sphingomonas sp. ERG5]
MDSTLEQNGAVRLSRAALSILGVLDDLANRQPRDRAGIRLRGIAALTPLVTKDGPLGALAAQELGNGCRPVRAILFDKTEAANWALGWHQDRTIVVRERHETPGFGPWTIKAGMIHVAPPADLLAGMVTMRVHLDDVPADNAPLLIAPGSHQLGRIAEAEIDRVAARCGTIACLAERGDVWLYATLILHASAAAARPARRRVLQIDFAANDLPGELEWLGLRGGDAAP